MKAPTLRKGQTVEVWNPLGEYSTDVKITGRLNLHYYEGRKAYDMKKYQTPWILTWDEENNRWNGGPA